MAPQSTTLETPAAITPGTPGIEAPAAYTPAVYTSAAPSTLAAPNSAATPSTIKASRTSPFSYITPNWFASVMGTGIIATAAVTLPVQLPGQRAVATGIWVLASLMLITAITATALHWIKFPQVARSHVNNPVMAHFYGAPAMALMTVSSGTLLLGQDVLGHRAALIISSVLWSAGTLLGLVFAVLIPCVQFLRHRIKFQDAFGGWLMPVVSPMVTASTSALFIQYLPVGQARTTMLLFGYSMFGLSLFASLTLFPIIWAKLAVHGVGKPAMVPTLWLLLGPMGQSITAVNLLATNSGYAVSSELVRSLEIFGIVYGVAMLGMAGLWGAISLTLTLRTARRGLPFALTWWSFTFPVGTCVTGLSGLALHTGLGVFKALAVAVYVGLVAIWLVVLVRTFAGTFVRHNLLAAPAA